MEYKNKSENQQIWLINDRKSEAGDNGEYFFRYLYQLKPKGIKFFFSIKKNSTDYERLKIYDNIIDLDSTLYLSIFLKADKIISSVSESWVSNAFGEDGKYIVDLYHFDFIYLQNGIIKDDLSLYLNRIATNFDLLISSSAKEYKSFINYKYGYSYKSIVLTGFLGLIILKIFKKKYKKKKLF